MPRPKGRRRLEKLNKARNVMLSGKLRGNSSRPSLGPASEGQRGASRSKLDRLSINTDVPSAIDLDLQETEQLWTIANTNQLTDLMSDALCPNCFQSSLTIRVIKDENMGFASKLKLCCSSCGYTKSKFSSPIIHKSNCSSVAFEINTKMVLYSHEIGKGFTSLQTFSSVLGISGISQRAFKDHDNKITDCEVESGEDMLYRTANAIRQGYAETDDDIREAIE
ncbi:tubulin beta chain-like isoform X1 [Biomphalaria pfeifferi]|uniref:Tubulin beta chain-like isoform X1 n=1 Tax=Biomphalaria pfeifferi TaxID=112525 RepID=A0AAD8BNX9_BIOPF|nr:tubulin beta chain-like isoform X1 [Biomphalaria pfeifferi]